MILNYVICNHDQRVNGFNVKKGKEALMKTILFLLSAVFILSACSPTVGSEKWCAQLKEKAKGEWTANEAVEFTKKCLIRLDDDNK